MEFKNTHRPFSSNQRQFWRPYLLIGTTFLFSSLLFGIIGLGMLRQASPHRYNQFLQSIPQLPTAIGRYFKNAQAEMPVLHLDVNHLDLQQMAYDRHQFFLEEQDIDYQFVSGDIRMGEEKIPIKIRLKGDRYIHVSDQHRWSFRVHVKGENAVMGMKYFSLHLAGARNYLYEWIFHRLLRKEGFVALRYEFVRLYLNGKALGVYALEEHFDKRLVEHSQFREGPILKFDEDLTGDLLNMSVVRPFREEQWMEPEKQPLLEEASSLLESYRRGEASIGEVFDVDKLATFFAITDILNVRHGSMWKSIRFYYNPISARIEPIGFDGHFNPELAPRFFLAAQSSQEPQVGFCRERASWYDHIFFPSDTIEEAFFSSYVQALERFAQDEFLDAFFEEFGEEIQLNLSRIYADYPTPADHIFWYGPDLHYFSKLVFYQKKRYIQKELHPEKHLVFAFKGSHVPGKLTIEASNIHTLPQELQTLYIDSLAIPFPTPVILLPRAMSDFVAYTPGYQQISISLPESISWHDSLWQHLKIGYHVLGTEGEQILDVSPWKRQIPRPIQAGLMRKRPNAEQFSFVSIDADEKRIDLQAGKWEIETDLIFPKGYSVHAGPGTVLSLRNRASILSYGPLKWHGSQVSPIRVQSPDSSGQGIFVFQADSLSELSQVIFSQLTPPSDSRWSLTGSVSFYESQVRFEEVHWQSCLGEDALNVIRSEFEMSHCYFDAAASDAMDVDFCTGSIRECWIQRSGNDGLDLSGSKVYLSGLSVSDSGDKGISIGEDSEVEAHHLLLANSQTALAIKDHSNLLATKVRIDSCEIGWVLYEKKAEYGGASATLNTVIQSSTPTPYIIEKGSRCLLDGQELLGDQMEVQAIVDRLNEQ